MTTHKKKAWSACVIILRALYGVSEDIKEWRTFIHPLWKTVWHDPIRLNMQLGPSNSTPRNTSKILAHLLGDMYKYVHNNTLYNRVKNWKHPKYPSIRTHKSNCGTHIQWYNIQ